MFIQKLIYKFKKKNIEIKQSSEVGIFVLKGQINNEQTYELIKGILDFSDKFPNKTITLQAIQIGLVDKRSKQGYE